jgi:SM-20-related protein
MALDLQTDNEQRAPGRSLMPPYLVLRDFLDDATVAGLLEYALSHEHAFEPTKVYDLEEGTTDPAIRVSEGTRNLGEFSRILKSKILELVPDLISKLRATSVEAPKLELQLVAHNHGAFYKRHIDTQTVTKRKDIRVLSGVYYFHTKPKGFTGGALRLYAIGEPASQTFVDIEPAHNTFLVFPSWAPHEVMPVICPSKRFIDSRFAINCWVHRSKHEPI